MGRAVRGLRGLADEAAVLQSSFRDLDRVCIGVIVGNKRRYYRDYTGSTFPYSLLVAGAIRGCPGMSSPKLL